MSFYKKSVWDIVFNIFNITLMLLVVVLMLYPFLYILFYSLSDPSKLSTGILLYPKGFSLASYQMVITNPDIVHAAFISGSRAIIGPLGSLVITSMCAYVLSRDDFMGVRFFRKLIILPMFFSVGMIPSYLVIKSLHLTGTYAVYIIPGLFGVFSMVLIKTYIENMPQDLQEAALIDGANDAQICFRIVLPVCIPVLAAITLFSFVGHWNSYVDTQIYNYMQKDLYTLQYVLYIFLSKQTVSSKAAAQMKMMTGARLISSQTLNMAMTVITVIPIIIVYPFVQKYFAAGIMVGSIKG